MSWARKSVIVAVAVFVQAVAADPPANDAWSGKDAGNTPAQALALQYPGWYTGAILPPGDQDWYVLRTPVSVPVCMLAGVRSTFPSQATVSPTTSQTPAVIADLPPTQWKWLGLATGIAAQGETTQYLGILPRPLPNAASATENPTTYDFYIRTYGASELGDGDGASGRDAGITDLTAVTLKRTCNAGQLSLGDTSDLYKFSAASGELVTISLASNAAAILKLKAPSGGTIGSIASGGVATLRLNETGTWYASVDLVQTATLSMIPYTFAVMRPMAIVEPDPNPCRPDCMPA